METRGRKPLPTASKPLEVNEELIRSDLARIDQLPSVLAAAEKDTTALAKTLGYEGPLAPDLLEEGARESLTRINFEIFSVGARLLLLKAQCPHGEFVERLDHLGIEYRMAARMMQATRKFPNVSTSTHLIALGKSKIFELVVLDDEEAEAFANGEEVRGITFDEAAKMSVAELRRRVRQADANKEAEISKVRSEVSGQMAAKDRLIADSKKRIAELVEEKNKREGMTDFEHEQALEARLANATLEAITYLIPIRATVDAIRGLDHAPQGLYVAMQAALHRVITEAESIATDYGISLDFGLPTLSTEDTFDAEALADLDDPNADEDLGPDYQSL